MAVLPVGIGPVTGYNIERSLRFNSADSAYLNRTPASAGNRKTWTWSGWVKRSGLGATQILFIGYVDSNNKTRIDLSSTETLRVYDITGGATERIKVYSTQVFRDVSAWYHIVVAVDTTQATASSRVKVYVNGSQITAFGTADYPSQNTDTYVNATNAHEIGREISSLYLNAYLTEVNFIDGQALTPSSFGETDPNTGVWRPKKYTGTYGTNGFYLNFADNSGTTSTTLGKDSSGNGNNWTPNNFSVTAGAGNDSLVDTPTPYGSDTGAGGEVRGNYVTMNPLNPATGVTSTLANGNLQATGASGTTGGNARATVTISSGKWYWETTELASATSSTNFYPFVGCVTGDDALFMRSTSGVPSLSGLNGWSYESDGTVNALGSGTVASASNTAINTNDVLGIGLDLDNGNVYFWVNGVAQNSGNAVITGLTGVVHQPAVGLFSSASVAFNFGQRPFAYTAPSGYKALCTTNLPTPTIGATSTTQANDYFNVLTYTGTGSSNAQTGVGFQPDLVWIKGRSGATDHGLYDAVRGVQKQLESNTTTAETTETTGLTAFGTDGFTVGALAQLNTNTATYVAWNWKANGAGSTNTAGTITSTVSANTTAGFSIVTYTGNGTNGATVGHGLGVAPKMVIVKRRDSATNGDWFVWTTMTGAGNNLFLNLTNASAAAAGPFNSTAPNSTVITLGTSTGTNANTSTYVAYCFAEVAGYSAFGSYTGNGSTDGTFVFTNFRPRYVLIKRTNDISDWCIKDAVRNGYNQTDPVILANASDSEYSSAQAIDILSNGFKLRSTGGNTNANGSTYIYMALAENPFKYSLAR